MVQIAFGVQSVCLGSFQQRKDDDTGVGAGLGIAEQPVLPADHNGPDSVLHLVIADLNLTVIKERAKVLPLVQGVGNRLLQLACRFEYGLQPGVIRR